jgi:hypothetical protein
MTAEQLIATAYAQSTDIHLMAGQSNMQGRAVDGTTLSSRANDGTIFEYRSGTTGRQTYLTNYPSGGPLTQFGPNVGMARTLNDGSHVIRYGAGGQSIAAFIPEARRLTSAPSIPAANSDHSTLIVDSFNAAISDLLLRHFKKPLNVDFIWYNGAEDAKTDELVKSLTSRRPATQPYSHQILTKASQLRGKIRPILTQHHRNGWE